MTTWDLLGRSRAIRDVVAQFERAGRSYGGVLVSGEPGTGRGRVARAIHALSRPAGAPFVALHCDEMEPPDIERQLFGDIQGPERALSGSDARAPLTPPDLATCEWLAQGSLLHKANGGTLYLRHVEDLPERVQARLAQVLRDRAALLHDSQTQGSPRPYLREPELLDVRPVTSVDTGFQKAVEEGRVRADLYRRLARFTIAIPPLRERREDIPALASHFVEQACRRVGAAPKTLTAAVLSVLGAMPWRGNVRELQGLMDLLVLKTEGPEINLEVLLSNARLQDPVGAPEQRAGIGGSLREARERWEREYITAVLAQHHGRIPDAARALGIQRTNLYRKLRLLRVSHKPRSGSVSPAQGPALPTLSAPARSVER